MTQHRSLVNLRTFVSRRFDVHSRKTKIPIAKLYQSFYKDGLYVATTSYYSLPIMYNEAHAVNKMKPELNIPPIIIMLDGDEEIVRVFDTSDADLAKMQKEEKELTQEEIENESKPQKYIKLSDFMNYQFQEASKRTGHSQAALRASFSINGKQPRLPDPVPGKCVLVNPGSEFNRLPPFISLPPVIVEMTDENKTIILVWVCSDEQQEEEKSGDELDVENIKSINDMPQISKQPLSMATMQKEVKEIEKTQQQACSSVCAKHQQMNPAEQFRDAFAGINNLIYFHHAAEQMPETRPMMMKMQSVMEGVSETQGMAAYVAEMNKQLDWFLMDDKERFGRLERMVVKLDAKLSSIPGIHRDKKSDTKLTSIPLQNKNKKTGGRKNRARK